MVRHQMRFVSGYPCSNNSGVPPTPSRTYAIVTPLRTSDVCVENFPGSGVSDMVGSLAVVNTDTPAGDAEWETVVGLEVHCELSTATKLFCGCANEFGREPNTNICPVCLGLPGSLPVLNEKAVEYALRVAEALHLDVPPRSEFARK